jgi:hypothetical protein
MFAREVGLDFTSISGSKNHIDSLRARSSLHVTMAEESGVTEAGLKAKIIEQLQATHVEIEDMSGIFCPTLPLHCPNLS